MNLLTIFCYYNQTSTFSHVTSPPTNLSHLCPCEQNELKKKRNTELCSDEYFQNLIRILGFSTVRQLEIDSE